MRFRATLIALVASGVVMLGTLSGQRTPLRTMRGLKAVPGLELTLFASEPMFSNPTNITIDERGRVWVLEAVNYRRSTPSQNRNLPDIRQAGDRIVILEDTNGDGKADKSKVFDQSSEIRAPLGLAVLGNKVYVSQAPNITVYTKDEDDTILTKEVLLSGWRGVDHDHGLHAVVFGPDGRLYFNSGNTGYDVTDKTGKRIQASGYEEANADFGPGKYWQGATYVMNQDGTGLQVVAHNFRNPYEVAIDSFGNLFQTDNDDDGNAWTRLNYLYEGGNYGFRGPLGRTWQTDGGGHFHNEVPGVVPNIERLGAGSPCGLVVYEGNLLPERFRGNLLHAEAGRRALRGYLLSEDGAGYSTKIEDVAYGDDPWYRPSDVAVAPDGTVYVADWYDPSVGGHGMGDKEGGRGRIYRLAPPRHKTQAPALDLESKVGLTAALRSPAQAVQFLAYQKLKRQGQAALPALQEMWKQDDLVLKARALWLLGGLGKTEVQEALRDSDPRVRILGLRVSRFHGADVLAISKPLLHDPSPQVRREIALMLQDSSKMIPPYAAPEQTTPEPELLSALVELAKQYDGQDRWYLEAVGIAARGRENALYTALRESQAESTSSISKLWWGLRPPAALPDLIATVNDGSRQLSDRLHALETLSVMASAEAAKTLEDVILRDENPPELAEWAFAQYRRQLNSLWTESRNSPGLAAVLKKGLASPHMQAAAVGVADLLGGANYAAELLEIAASDKSPDDARAAALDAIAKTRSVEYLPEYAKLVQTGPISLRVAAVRAIGFSGAEDLPTRAQALMLSNAPNEVRAEALRILARSFQGVGMILEMAEKGDLPSELKNLATNLVYNGSARRSGDFSLFSVSRRDGDVDVQPPNEAAALKAMRARARRLLPPIVLKNKRTIPSLAAIERNFRGDATNGKRVFNAEAGPKCGGCHGIGGPKKVGPDLSAIGTKMGKQGMIDAIVTPSVAIAPEYYVFILETKSEGQVIGVITEDTVDRVVVKVDAREEVRLKPSEITSRRQSKLSMMPDDLLSTMTMQQFADLLEYMTTLKDESVAAR